jgi:signal transduction histidine kinase
MRDMSRELERGRKRAIEAERAEAFRETARQVAHELKNPLTPIRFAVERLRREAPPELAESVEVLAIESRRLEEMAKSFAQFGRLPEGPWALVDVAELARYTARATVPGEVKLTVEVEDGLPMIQGHHDALARALSNVLINAVEACQRGGGITVRVARSGENGSGVVVSVRDTGCGMPPDRLARIWEPYVTYKQGGTGLGLAIARQTIDAHGGQVEAESAPGAGTEIRFHLRGGTAATKS